MKAIETEDFEENGALSSPQAKRRRGKKNQSVFNLEGYTLNPFIIIKHLYSSLFFYSLPNLGQTCFLNSVLQIVLNIPSFIGQLVKNNLPGQRLCNSLVNLSNSMKKGSVERV